jgi:hypothetical protein
MIGNSVSPIMAEAIFSAIGAHLGLVPKAVSEPESDDDQPAPIAIAAE